MIKNENNYKENTYKNRVSYAKWKIVFHVVVSFYRSEWINNQNIALLPPF